LDQKCQIKGKSQMIHNLWNSGNFIFELSQKIHFLSNSTIFTPNSIHKIFTTISTFLCNFHSFKSLTRLLYTSYKTNRTVPTVFHILEQYLGLEKVRVKSSHTLKIIWLDLFGLFLLTRIGYIDVGDGWKRQNVLVITIRFWWQFCPFWSPTATIFLQ